MNYYYHPTPESNSILSSEESSHAIKVLRMSVGDKIDLIDGLGSSYIAEITEANFRKCAYKVLSKTTHLKKELATHIAIAPTKNLDRIEWFVEKACELGVDQISLIQTKRTERSKIKLERLQKKAISAMKQSKNFWKCQISDIQKLDSFLKSEFSDSQKFVAYVETGDESLLQKMLKPTKNTIVLIGPEGDFTYEEIQQTAQVGFKPVSLGKNILRTETAGIVAAHTISLINQ